MFWQLISETYIFLKSISRNKETLFWLVVFPIVFLTMLVMIFASGGDTIEYDVGIVGSDNIIAEILGNISFINLMEVDSVDTLKSLLKNGSIDVGLYVETRQDIEVAGNITIYYIENYDASEIASQVIQGILNGVEDSIRKQMAEFASGQVPPEARGFFQLILDPLNVDMEGITPEIYGTVGGVKLFYVISMIGAQVIFIGMISGMINIHEKKRQGTIKLIASSPIGSLTSLLADTLSIFAGVLISLVAIMVTGYFLGADYSVLSFDKAILIVLLTIVSVTFTTGLGLTLSMIPKTLDGAMALANLISFPLLFAGGVVLPEFLLPDYLKLFAEYFPQSRLVITMRKMLLFNLPIEAIYFDIFYGVFWSILIYIIGALTYRKLLARAIENPM